MSAGRWRTVAARVAALGYRGEQAKHLAWEVGRIIRDQWISEYEEKPIFRLVQKTSGKGSHMMAVYPAGWQDRIDAAVIEAARLAAAAPSHTGQTTLF